MPRVLGGVTFSNERGTSIGATLIAIQLVVRGSRISMRFGSGGSGRISMLFGSRGSEHILMLFGSRGSERGLCHFMGLHSISIELGAAQDLIRTSIYDEYSHSTNFDALWQRKRLPKCIEMVAILLVLRKSRISKFCFLLDASWRLSDVPLTGDALWQRRLWTNFDGLWQRRFCDKWTTLSGPLSPNHPPWFKRGPAPAVLSL